MLQWTGTTIHYYALGTSSGIGGTGYKGVRQQGKKFRAQIKRKGKDKSLGTFDTAIAAALAYDQAAIKNGNTW